MAKRHFTRKFAGNEVLKAGLTPVEQDFTLPSIVLTIPGGAVIERATLDFELYSCYSPSANIALFIFNNTNPTRMTIQKAPGAETDAMIWPVNPVERYSLGKPANTDGASNGGSVFRGTEEFAAYLTAQGAGTYVIRFRDWKVNVGILNLYGAPVLTVEFSIDDVAGATELQTVDDNVDAILVDTDVTLPATLATMDGKLDIIDTNVDDIETDTGTTIPATLTSIEGKVDTIDNVVDDIKEAIITIGGAVVDDVANTASTFETDLAEASDDFYNNIQILFISGNNAGQARRISDYDGGTKFITVSEAFDAEPVATDDFLLIGRIAGASTSLTEAGIADAVWDELKAGHVIADSYGKLVQDIETDVNAVLIDTNDMQPRTLAIQIDTNEIQTKLPTKAKIRGTADADGGMDTEDKADIEAECTDALNAYDPPTRTEATADKDEIIAEIDGNETKIDTIISDLATHDTDIKAVISTHDTDIKLDIATHDTDIKALIGTPVADLAADIASLAADLATHDTDIKLLIGTPTGDLVTEINVNEAKLDQIIAALALVHNNTTRVLVVPQRIVRPDAGTKAYGVYLYNYDKNDYSPRDFDIDPIVRADYIGAGAYIAPTSMTRVSTGVYEFEWDSVAGDALGVLLWDFEMKETYAPDPQVTSHLPATSEITDYDTELAEIKADTEQIIIDVADLDADLIVHDTHLTSVETNLTAEIDENEVKLDTVLADTDVMLSIPDPTVKFTGSTTMETSDGLPLLTGAVTIPVRTGTGHLFNPYGGFVIIDRGGLLEEELEYSSITDDDIALVGATANDHDDGVDLEEVTKVTLHLSIRKKNGEQNEEADSTPVATITDRHGVVDHTDSMAWDAGTRTYSVTFEYYPDEEVGQRTVKFVVIENAISRTYQKDIEIIDRPASDVELNEIIDSVPMPDTFLFNQDGWWDDSEVFTDWTDIYVGALLDTYGRPITGAIVRAYVKDPVTGRYVLSNQPNHDSSTNVLGYYLGYLEAGTYLFTIYKDGIKLVEVERVIG